MAQEANQAPAGFVLGQEPVMAARALEMGEADDVLSAEPLLWAFARNPQQILVCWSVNWRDAFVTEEPPDRKVYLRLTGKARERLIEVEPTSGYITLSDLEPGATYSAELGYFISAKKWEDVVSLREVSTPSVTESAGDGVDVALIPLHLGFQKIIAQMHGRPPAELSLFLAELQSEMTEPAGSGGKSAVLSKSLGFSQADIEETALARAALEAAAPLPRTKTRPAGRSGSPRGEWRGGS